MRFQPYDKVNGWPVLRNKAQVNKWFKDEYYHGGGHPSSYPALGEMKIDGGEDTYAVFYDVGFVENMMAALKSKPLAKPNV